MANIGRSHPSWKHGLRSGFTEYRYGNEGSRPVTLAGQKPSRPALTKDRRKHVVSQILDQLRDFQCSPFEQEGAIRAGVRSSLCLQGHGWGVADLAAEGVLSEAFRQLGIARPTWAQGQREYAEARDICAWCKVPLDEELVTARRRFCSEVCSAACKQHNAVVFKAAQQHARSWAHYLVSTERSEERYCEECKEAFRSRDPNAKFCSHPCFLRHSSKKTIVKECMWCGGGFKAGNKAAKFCSKSCAEAVGSIRRGTWVPKRITGPFLDYLFRCEGLRLTTGRRMMDPRLTSEIFDGWFKSAA